MRSTSWKLVSGSRKITHSKHRRSGVYAWIECPASTMNTETFFLSARWLCLGSVTHAQTHLHMPVQLFLPDVPASADLLFHLACGPQEFTEGGRKGRVFTFCHDVIKEHLGNSDWGPVKKAEQFAEVVFKTLSEDGKDHNVHGEKMAKLSDGDRKKLIAKTLKKMPSYSF